MDPNISPNTKTPQVVLYYMLSDTLCCFLYVEKSVVGATETQADDSTVHMLAFARIHAQICPVRLALADNDTICAPTPAVTGIDIKKKGDNDKREPT